MSVLVYVMREQGLHQLEVMSNVRQKIVHIQLKSTLELNDDYMVLA